MNDIRTLLWRKDALQAAVKRAKPLGQWTIPAGKTWDPRFTFTWKDGTTKDFVFPQPADMSAEVFGRYLENFAMLPELDKPATPAKKARKK